VQPRRRKLQALISARKPLLPRLIVENCRTGCFKIVIITGLHRFEIAQSVQGPLRLSRACGRSFVDAAKPRPTAGNCQSGPRNPCAGLMFFQCAVARGIPHGKVTVRHVFSNYRARTDNGSVSNRHAF